MKKTLILAATTAFIIGANVSLTSMANAAAYSKCKACHNFTAKKKVGPGWKGLYGRTAGTAPHFKYKFTKYISGDAWTWDDEHLRAWMCNSKKAIKAFTNNPKAQTKMPPQKICSAAKQDEIIAFMKTLK